MAGNSSASLEDFYDRLAADLRGGRPMVVTVYVALCDNESQGIIPVKNPSICDGDVPERNLYWSTSGGLKGWARKHGWKRVYRERSNASILDASVWRKRARPGGELKARGVKKPFYIYLVGLAYRGVEIDLAMRDYLHAVNHDQHKTISLDDNTTLIFGGKSHIVGYLGHDYFLDVDADEHTALMGENEGKSVLAKGTFALACEGNEFIRPAISRQNVYIFILNKQLAYPGAWTIGGIVEGVAWGESGRQIHKRAARAFADGMNKPYGAIMRSFASGP